MPIYDYVCSVCRHRLEVVHGIHDHGPSECPICGGAMRKAMVAPAIHFKGSGWAKKDRGSAARTKAAAKADGAQSTAAVTEGGPSAAVGESSSGPGPTEPSPSPAAKAAPVSKPD